MKRKGWELLRNESALPEETIGPFIEVNQEISWSPQMYHRLRLLDLFISLELQVAQRPHVALVKTFLEYRRVKGSHQRETTDYVVDQETPENRIVPDGAFVLENAKTGRSGLFLVEMDMGTERIVAKGSRDTRATVHGKFEQYDRYLTSGRFAQTYAPYGQFRAFSLLFVSLTQERIENIRAACVDLPDQLHPYYRLSTWAIGAALLVSIVLVLLTFIGVIPSKPPHPQDTVSAQPGSRMDCPRRVWRTA